VSLRSTILASACAVALGVLSGPAFADGMSDFSGVLGVDYSNININHGIGDANAWGGDGSAMFGFGGSAVAGEVDGSYHSLDIGHGLGDANAFDIDGSVFWRGGSGRIGAVLGYSSVDHGGNHTTNYGGFGEWFAASSVTLGVKAGGISGGGGGYYVSGAATFYAMPDLALAITDDYSGASHGSNENDWGASAEWLVSERTPVSVFGVYERANLGSDFFGSGGGGGGFGGHISANVWFVGLRLYTDPEGPAPLVERQRSGAARWGTSSSLFGFEQ
jgi:hypothetical protein